MRGLVSRAAWLVPLILVFAVSGCVKDTASSGDTVAVPERVDTDYPGWRLVGSRERAVKSDTSGSRVFYYVRLHPPGESFDVEIVYRGASVQTARPVEEVLRVDGVYERLRTSLLEYLASRREERSFDVVSVVAGEGGEVTLGWNPVNGAPGISGDPLPPEVISYDDERETWAPAEAKANEPLGADF